MSGAALNQAEAERRDRKTEGLPIKKVHFYPTRASERDITRIITDVFAATFARIPVADEMVVPARRPSRHYATVSLDYAAEHHISERIIRSRMHSPHVTDTSNGTQRLYARKITLMILIEAQSR